MNKDQRILKLESCFSVLLEKMKEFEKYFIQKNKEQQESHPTTTEKICLITADINRLDAQREELLQQRDALLQQEVMIGFEEILNKWK